MSEESEHLRKLAAADVAAIHELVSGAVAELGERKDREVVVGQWGVSRGRVRAVKHLTHLRVDEVAGIARARGKKLAVVDADAAGPVGSASQRAAARTAELEAVVEALGRLTDEAARAIGERALSAVDPRRSAPERKHAQTLLAGEISRLLRRQPPAGSA